MSHWDFVKWLLPWLTPLVIGFFIWLKRLEQKVFSHGERIAKTEKNQEQTEIKVEAFNRAIAGFQSAIKDELTKSRDEMRADFNRIQMQLVRLETINEIRDGKIPFQKPKPER